MSDPFVKRETPHMSKSNLAEAEETLQPEDRHMFRLLIEDYKELAEKHVGMTVVHYKILADLVNRGWNRPVQELRIEELLG
jgi:hypothetical protein